MGIFSTPNINRLLKEKNLDGIIKALSFKKSFIRKQAAIALGILNERAAAVHLIEAMNDEDTEVRNEAIKALMKMDYTESIDPYIKALKADDFAVRWDAREAIKNIKEASFMRRLFDELKNPNTAVGAEVSIALESMGENAVVPLIETLGDKNVEVRIKAVDILGRIKDERAIGPLVEHLKHEEPKVRERIVIALKELRYNRKVTELLAGLLENEDKEVQKAAVYALQRIKWRRIENINPAVRSYLNNFEWDKFIKKRSGMFECEIEKGEKVNQLVKKLGFEEGEGLLIKPSAGLKARQGAKISGTIVCHGCGTDVKFNAEILFGLSGGAGSVRCQSCGCVIAFTSWEEKVGGKECYVLIAQPHTSPVSGMVYTLKFKTVSCKDIQKL